MARPLRRPGETQRTHHPDTPFIGLRAGDPHRMTPMRSILIGAAAGAAGTTALNAATYLDMAVRGRSASQIPEQVVERLSAIVRVPVPGDGEEHDNRIAGLGALLGAATGVGTGAAYGLARALGWRPGLPVASVAVAATAMAGADVPLAVLGVSHPRQWRPADWASDLLPHLAYGAVTAAVQAAADRK
jgi:hypothetical protein